MTQQQETSMPVLKAGNLAAAWRNKNEYGEFLKVSVSYLPKDRAIFLATNKLKKDGENQPDLWGKDAVAWEGTDDEGAYLNIKFTADDLKGLRPLKMRPTA